MLTRLETEIDSRKSHACSTGSHASDYSSFPSVNICNSIQIYQQVYIVAVEKQKNQSDTNKHCLKIANSSEESYRDVTFSASGLLDLVQADLGTLSKLWLAALQDFALLTLPPEYASQLPTEGKKANELYFHLYRE